MENQNKFTKIFFSEIQAYCVREELCFQSLLYVRHCARYSYIQYFLESSQQINSWFSLFSYYIRENLRS